MKIECVSVKLNKSNDVTVKDVNVKAGKINVFLLQGHPEHDYDVTPFCCVEVTSELATVWLQRLDSLRSVQDAKLMGSVSFHGEPVAWFSVDDDEHDYLFEHDAVLLSAQQVKLLEDGVMGKSSFRRSGTWSCVNLQVNARPSGRELEGVWFSTYEKHCDVQINTCMIYRGDLEKIAGKLYQRP